MVSTVIELKMGEKPSNHTSLLVGCPKSVRDLLRLRAATNSSSLAICSDFDCVQLVQVDLDTMVHSSESCDGAMSCVEGEERQTLLIGVLDLKGNFVTYDSRGVHINAYRYSNILLSARYNNDVDFGSIQNRPTSRSLFELG